MIRHALYTCIATLLAGCGSMSGLDGKSEFACRAPDGVVCTSVSGVYANSLAGALPAQTNPEAAQAKPSAQREETSRAEERRDSKPQRQYAQSAAFAPVSGPVAPGDPLLDPPKVLRVWIAPWVDDDGDLHAESFIYVMWHRGEWKVQHSRRQVRDRFQSVKAPPQTMIAPPTTSSTRAEGGNLARSMAARVPGAQQEEEAGDQ